jgi:signal transduction histidine kinase
MEERVRLLKGTFRIRTQPGEGTEVHAWVPVAELSA